MNKFIVLLAFATLALCDTTYNLQYTSYSDNVCNNVNPKMTGQIFPYTCAPEYLFTSPSSGKITYIDDMMLTSCDYDDTTCGKLLLCENYTRDACYSSKTVAFSNKYSWTLVDGAYVITYSSYSATGCTGTVMGSPSTISPNKCGLEYQVKPSSGKITYITDNWLTSCDYSDANCQQVTICVNYTNSFCNSAQFTAFSDKYSWTSSAPLPTPAPASTVAPTASPSGSASPANSGENYRIAYVAFDDNSCTNVDTSMSGEIFAHTCSAEMRTSTSAGMIIFINDNMLVSCDYSDSQCTNLKNCENYTNDACANSDSKYAFSNKYKWSKDANGVYAIQYTSYTAANCESAKLSTTSSLVQNYCSPETSVTPQSGMITAINDDYLVSCDYSDKDCKNQIVCETYYNRQCYASEVTSFSNLYAWTRSSASSVAAGVFLATIAAVFAML